MPNEATAWAVESAGLLEAWRAMREFPLSKQGAVRMARLRDWEKRRQGNFETSTVATCESD
jgi:hypothetical protein